MASSSYYYRLYTQKKSDVKKYDNNIKALRKIYNNLTGTMSDEIQGVNRKLDDLKDDLNNGIRHNSIFEVRANSFAKEKEKSVTIDSKLRVAVNELDEEITRVTRLRNSASEDMDIYYRRYKNKKDEERQELLDKLK